MLPENREPTLPGEVLQEEFLAPLGMTQTDLAGRLGIPIQRLNAIVRGRRAVSAETAILFAKAFSTTPEFWLNLQTAVDLWRARKRLDKADGAEIVSIFDHTRPRPTVRRLESGRKVDKVAKRGRKKLLKADAGKRRAKRG